MCLMTEKMRIYATEQIEETSLDTSHNVELVASVSYDREKKQFNYASFGGKSSFIDGINLEELKRTQNKTLEIAH